MLCSLFSSLVYWFMLGFFAFISWVSFLHESMQYVDSNFLYAKSNCHKSCTWKVFFLHELMQYVYSNHSFVQGNYRKCCIWKVSFLHELLLHVFSNCLYLKNSYHKSCSSVASITNTALESFLSFMNCFHIFIQIAFIWKTLITKVVVQSLHWKGFLPSWTTSIWFFKLFYLKFWNWD